MKINEFMEAVKKDKLTKIETMIEVKKYVPIIRKRQIAKEVFDSCITRNGNYIEVDSLAKYLSFTMMIIMEYTNLEFTVDENGVATSESIDEYDALCENGYIDTIIATFADDYARSLDVLNMYFKDNVDSVNSPEAILNRLSIDLVDNAATLTDKLVDSLQHFDDVAGKIDTKEIVKLFENFTKE